MTRDDAGRLITSISQELNALNPAMPTDTVRRLFEVGELRVGLEILCDNLADAEIAVSSRIKEDIAAVAAFLKMPDDYWRDLATLPDASR